MLIQRDELVATLTTDASGNAGICLELNPQRATNAFPWLSGIAKSWDRIVWYGARVSWRPAVGTTADGMIAYGFHWDPTTVIKEPKRSQVTSLTPVKDHPIWQSTDLSPLIAPTANLMSRRFFIMRSTDRGDAAPACLQAAVSGARASTMVGELWLRYHVALQGPTQSA